MAGFRPRGGHSSGTPIAGRLAQPTRATGPEETWTRVSPRRPYSVLLPVGFAVPFPLPGPRWALTPPFHPDPVGPPRKAPSFDRSTASRRPRRGGLFSVALSLRSPSPAVGRHRLSVEPGLSSPRFPPERPPGRLARRAMGERGRRVKVVEDLRHCIEAKSTKTCKDSEYSV